MDDYYKILGVTKNATSETIRQAYINLVKKYHPDVCHEPFAEELLKKINQAYDVLSDSQKKRSYDNYLNQQTGNLYPQTTQSDETFTHRDIPREPERAWWKNPIIVIGVIIGVLIIAAFLSGIFSTTESPGNNNNYISPPLVGLTSENPPVPTPDIIVPSYPRPATGTVLESQYLNGNGVLEVDNAQGSSDAIVTLTRISSKIPVYSVYIRKGSTYEIEGLPDGSYNVYFAMGENWDTNKKRFLINPYYQKFEDSFEFYTTATHYPGWEITLYGTFTGNAETDSVNENDFPQL